MSKQKDKNYPRVGDFVRIDNPQMFIRCGYPLGINDVREEIRKNHLKKIEDFITGILCEEGNGNKSLDNSFGDLRNNVPSICAWKIINALAYERLKAKKFGGRERSIHTEFDKNAKGKIFKINKTRCVMTGTYSPPSGGYDYWSGEYDYEPGYLNNQERHRILMLSPCEYTENVWSMGGYYEIEDCHVTKIEDPEKELNMQKSLASSHQTIYTKTIANI
ncbi:MAG: hypothetical protein WC119_01640 [Synergistaceae bacterium]